MRGLSRFELRPGLHRPHHLRNGAIAFAVLALVLTTTLTRHVPFWPRGGDIVRADLASGVNLNGTTPVRVDGVNVGHVAGVERNPDGPGVVVRMRITDNSVKLHRDASLDVHYRTLLGLNVVIDLHPGSPSAPKLDGPIPLRATTRQPEVDEVLSPLDANARGGLRTFTREFDKAFGDPAAVGTMVREAPSGLTRLGAGLPALRGTRPGTDLPQLVRTASRAMGAVSADDVALANFVDSADVAFGVAAARGDDLSAALRDGPASLSATRATMARLTTTLDTLDPLAEHLLPGVRRLDETARAARGALREATPVLTAARPTFRDLAPAAAALRTRVAGPGTALLADLKPTVDRLRDDIVPFLKADDDETHMPNYQSIGPALAIADSLTSRFDAYGHSIVFEPSIGHHVMKGADCTSLLVDKSEKKPFDCQATVDVLTRLFGVKR